MDSSVDQDDGGVVQKRETIWIVWIEGDDNGSVVQIEAIET